MNHEESALFAKKYLEDVLSFFGLNTDIETHVSDEVIELKVPSTHLNAFLIGAHGDTLRSLQYLVSTTLKNKNAELYRINIDVADYKAQRADRLIKKLTETFEKVRSNGEQVALDPMNPADRRVVHQAISDYGDLETHSEGEGRDRYIVISKKSE
jgi:spoIIIJ-associated protein